MREKVAKMTNNRLVVKKKTPIYKLLTKGQI